MGAMLRQRLEGIMARSDVVGDVRGAGLLMAVEVVDDKAASARSRLKGRGGGALPDRLCERPHPLYTAHQRGRFGDWSWWPRR